MSQVRITLDDEIEIARRLVAGCIQREAEAKKEMEEWKRSRKEWYNKKKQDRKNAEKALKKLEARKK